MINQATIGPHKLLFGTFAARRFCEYSGCTNAPNIIMGQLLDADTRQDAMFNVVKSGLAAYAASLRQPFTLDEYAITEIYDQCTEQEGETISFGFIGAVVNKAPADVPAYLESLRLKVEEMTAAQEKKQQALNSPAGSALSNGDTATA